MLRPPDQAGGTATSRWRPGLGGTFGDLVRADPREPNGARFGVRGKPGNGLLAWQPAAAAKWDWQRAGAFRENEGVHGSRDPQGALSAWPTEQTPDLCGTSSWNSGNRHWDSLTAGGCSRKGRDRIGGLVRTRRQFLAPA